MKQLLTLIFSFALAVSLAVPAFSQEASGTQEAPKAEKKAPKANKETAGTPTAHTYSGEISDAMCGATHKMKGSPRECTLACVKGGSKYAFVSKGKVYEISNQDFAGLEEHAGHQVSLTGTKSADGKSIAVDKIAMTKSAEKPKAKA